MIAHLDTLLVLFYNLVEASAEDTETCEQAFKDYFKKKITDDEIDALVESMKCKYIPKYNDTSYQRDREKSHQIYDDFFSEKITYEEFQQRRNEMDKYMMTNHIAYKIWKEAWEIADEISCANYYKFACCDLLVESD